MKPAAILLLLLAPAAVRSASAQRDSALAATALAHYDLTERPAWRATLPAPLKEASGIAAVSSTELLIHGDERAVIWRYDPSRRRAAGRFGLRLGPRLLHGDFEDVAIAGGRLFLVTARGEIFEGRLAADGRVRPAVRRSPDLGGTCEAEGLAWDPPSRSLLLLCKSARSERWNGSLIVLAVSIDTWRFERAPRFVVPPAALARVTGRKAFHGSAIARYAVTGSFLVLAGPERTFVEIGPRGELLGGGALDRDQHPQPEGITVAPDLTLYICDEATGHRAAGITAYAYHP